MQTSRLRSVLFVALVGGCAGSGQFTYASEATTPDLVVISPGVQVIANLDEPVFYSDNYYWRNQGGFWYRSAYHTRGWARVDVAPVRIRAIAQPSAYVRYHRGARATVGSDHRVRAPAPAVRDHREYERNDKHDGKDKRDKRDGNDKHDGKDKHDNDKHDDKRD